MAKDMVAGQRIDVVCGRQTVGSGAAVAGNARGLVSAVPPAPAGFC